MKILQLCAVDFTLYHFLLPLMRELRDAGHEVVGACAPGKLSDFVRREGFRVVDLPIHRSANPVGLWRSYAAIRRFLATESFDLVHFHTPVAALVGRIAAWRVGVPRIVYTAHGFYFHERMRFPPFAAHVAIEWLAGRCTDLLLTQAAEDAAFAERLRLARGRVIAIGNGSDPDRFRPDGPGSPTRRATRKELGTTDDRPVVLSVGRLVAEKGFPELVAAMRNVDAELWIVGERLPSDHAGTVAAAIAAAQSEPALASRVRFLGYRQDVPDLMRAADIFVLPSHREGMPRSIIEAMLSGLPVVATDIRGSREEVVHGTTGFLVPVGDPTALADTLDKLLSDRDMRNRMGQAGRARACEHFDERRVVAKQVALLSELLEVDR